MIKSSCSLGSPGVEFIKASSKCKVKGTPKYVPTSLSVDWNAVAEEIAVGPDGDSLNEDSLDKLTMPWRYGIGWTEERAIC